MVEMKYKELKASIIKKNPDDPKRHKSRCIHYKNKKCEETGTPCHGSAHCKDYWEASSREDEKVSKITTPKEPSIVRSMDIVLCMSNSKYNDKFGTNSRKIIDLMLFGALQFNNYDKYSLLGNVYIKTETGVVLVVDYRKKREIIRSGDCLTVRLFIKDLQLNHGLPKKYIELWKGKDDFLGEVIFISRAPSKQRAI